MGWQSTAAMSLIAWDAWWTACAQISESNCAGENRHTTHGGRVVISYHLHHNNCAGTGRKAGPRSCRCEACASAH